MTLIKSIIPIDMENLISIIVPVYNVEEYIGECIESIMAQSYKKIEIIIVNDGTIDNSAKICENYAKTDDRIRVLHKINGGLSSARNFGMSFAVGEFITFIDSDDLVPRTYIEDLYDALISKDADISTCGVRKFFDRNELRYIKKPDVLCYTGEEALESMLYRKKITSYAHGKLFKKNLFSNIQFPVNELYEDISTIYKLLSKANRVAIDMTKSYYYRQRKESIVSTSSYQKKEQYLLPACNQISLFVDENHTNIKKAVKSLEFFINLDILRDISPCSKQKTIRNKTNQNLKKLGKAVSHDKKNKLPIRVAAMLCSIFPIGLYAFCKTYDLNIRIKRTRIHTGRENRRINNAKIAILKSDKTDFERFYISNMKTEDADVYSTYLKYNLILEKIKMVHIQILKLPFESIWYGKWKRKIMKYETIIVFDRILDDEILDYIYRMNPFCRIVFWHWNIINDKKSIINKNFCEVWSFDKNDCLSYGFKYCNQFYFDNIVRKEKENLYDAFFVGRDKDRTMLIHEVYERLTRVFGYKVFFAIIKSKNSKDTFNNSLTKREMKYSEILDVIEQSKCIVEINQGKQSGLSIRTLESIFLNKKLITNNISIVNKDFYNENNIFVIGIDNWGKLDEFFENKYKKIPKEVLSKYTYKSWLSKLTV